MGPIPLIFNQPNLVGNITIPGDKSISHRSIMLGAIAEGKTIVDNFLMGEDCLSTISCFRSLGVDIVEKEGKIFISGNGFEGLKEPQKILDVGNSGTTIRLLLGILAGRPFQSRISGDDSISKRPMKRVVEPLRLMGAEIDGSKDGQFTPLSVRGKVLHSMEYKMNVASAQVKSAIMLAALQAEGTTSIKEPMKSRDHTEQMIRYFGGNVITSNGLISILGKQKLKGRELFVPGDISSAAFFLAAGVLTKKSEITLEKVGLNPTRTGVMDVLKLMGANIEIKDVSSEFEPFGTIIVKSSNLTGMEIGGELIPRLIDEIPVIALMATQAKGITMIKDAEELKVKETNRIDTVVSELKKLGANIQSTKDGMVIKGPTELNGGTVNSHGDHRIGMMLAIASLITKEPVYLHGAEAINISYPSFFQHLQSIVS